MKKNDFFLQNINPLAKKILFYFPYAGSGASIGLRYVNAFPEEIAVVPIQFPGRENRLDEPPYTDMADLISHLSEEMTPLLDRPYYLWGHCLGGLIAYELALTINAWCFDFENGFQRDNYLSLIEGFCEYSSINQNEKESLNVLLRGAAVRILITRLHDLIYHPKDALVIPKNPMEYLKILEWHQKNTKIDL